MLPVPKCASSGVNEEISHNLRVRTLLQVIRSLCLSVETSSIIPRTRPVYFTRCVTIRRKCNIRSIFFFFFFGGSSAGAGPLGPSEQYPQPHLQTIGRRLKLINCRGETSVRCQRRVMAPGTWEATLADISPTNCENRHRQA